jgi:phytoene dehydrogenase-like protein
MNKLIDPSYEDLPALVIIKGIEEAKGRSYRVLTAFELSFPEHVAQWKDSTTGTRPAGYIEYKQERVKSITERILRVYPEYADSFRVVDAASILTFRDYLNSPDGSAYGIKQKVGQFNLFGKLPLRNLYAAGQSSVLPGLVGAMMSSFLVGRSIVGKEAYTQFIAQRLDH